ncbi:MAG: squalene/phytoene synthase family protein [Acidobacteriota bacterium]
MTDRGGAAADLDRLLAETSRTFALSIPLLPEPTRREVTVAYLLFRIADTFEDASHWSVSARRDALAGFGELLRRPSLPDARRLAAQWAADRPSEHPGYVSLVAEIPAVLEDFLSLSPGAIAPIRDHLLRSAEGMAGFVGRTDERGELALASLEELRDYCYTVAGIVGEMLTELFLLGRSGLEAGAPVLRPRARLFGEGLQLVNILKDSDSDAAEGRRYVPDSLPRAEVFVLARRDLEAAGEYILELQARGAPSGILGFTALPVELAWATLERVEVSGPGARISRPEVAAIAAALAARLGTGRPAVKVRRQS